MNEFVTEKSKDEEKQTDMVGKYEELQIPKKFIDDPEAFARYMQDLSSRNLEREMVAYCLEMECPELLEADTLGIIQKEKYRNG